MPHARITVLACARVRSVFRAYGGLPWAASARALRGANLRDDITERVSGVGVTFAPAYPAPTCQFLSGLRVCVDRLSYTSSSLVVKEPS